MVGAGLAGRRGYEPFILVCISIYLPRKFAHAINKLSLRTPHQGGQGLFPHVANKALVGTRHFAGLIP